MSFEQVKQCTKTALERTGPSGQSSRAANEEPSWPLNSKRSVFIKLVSVAMECVACNLMGPSLDSHMLVARAFAMANYLTCTTSAEFATSLILCSPKRL